MLLSILLVADNSNPYSAETLKQALLSSLQRQAGWAGKYEILTVTLSESDVAAVSGKAPGVNAVMVEQHHVENCKGDYVWIVPSLVTLTHADAAIASLLDVLSLRVRAVALATHGKTIAFKVTLLGSALQVLPSAQRFDDFRYVLSRDDLMACFGADANYQTVLNYLSSMENQGSRMLYAQVPAAMAAVKGVVSYGFFSLCMAYYSGTRPWQREVLNLPRSLISGMHNAKQDQAQGTLEASQAEALRHFFFSSCSALEYFCDAMFSERTQGMSKSGTFAVVTEVLENLATLSDNSSASSPLMPHVTQLSCFLSQWQKSASDAIASETVNSAQQRGPLYGIWALDRELKEDLNQLGKKKLQALIMGLRGAIETIALRSA